MSRRNANLIKTPEQMVQARVAAQLAADVLTMIAPHVKPGVTTAYLDQLCNDYIVNVQQAIPANVGYGGFPATVCSSVNHVVCHGIPSATQVLKNGDIINIDVAVIKDGWHGDTSRMYYVGEPSKPTRKLVETTYAAMWAGIRAVKPKATLGDVGFAIQTVAEKAGYSVVLDYCGHGIGQVYHEDPQVTHYGRPGQGMVLKPGMLFTIEPMINAGKAATKELSDGWTVETRDKSLSAQWEHMVHVTETGFEVLTLAPGETGAKANIPNAVPAGVEISAA
ncbi:MULTISPECIES: type I methionyl aminopeptidase [unclassified Duganella]|jgi:methionyl aminopeptidase|uniref:type I methionyl aminopeptidase n=1 Tax=unclassified Duganella TaxID=2636909 RepID=UPI00088A231A|nr:MULTISPECIES: type I methionyl aminopeptidase [unclassified Duganella]SDG16348.1 methionyl aminopeptidase [Duganella sp. OV458]SDJ31588.1 methionyl aminopeptidase [Duganella sp. OV510]